MNLASCQILKEAARLSTSAYQETLANAIVAGTKSYYEKAAKV
ncbi:MAG: hypothetical protein ACLTYH_09675 [Streptococcus salivarius]